MASVAGEINQDYLASEEAKEVAADNEYYKEEATSPYDIIAGSGSALVVNKDGALGLKFLPIGEENIYDAKARG